MAGSVDEGAPHLPPMNLSRREVVAGVVATAAGASLAGRASAAAAPSSVLEEHDALGLARLVARKQVTAAELLDMAIVRAEALNPAYNFLARKHYDYARKAIARGLPEGPFTGVPWLIKDLSTYIAGEVTGQGSRYYKDARATVTSELVRRHERAGLVIFGKTTTPEFGLTPTTESAATGATRNPWDPSRTSGGSSGGAAVAVAAGVIPAAHATDGGGSIRIPASCCGLFGLKPSRGRVPMGPLRTEGWGGMSVAHAITRSVRDSAAILDATHGIEPGSRYGAPSPERPFLDEVRTNPGKLRIALSVTPMAGTPVDPEVVAAVQAAARLCESLGHHVEEAAPQLDAGKLGRASFAIVSSSLAADLQARETATGIAPGLDGLEPVTLAYYTMGLKTTGVEYARANNDLQEAAVTMAQFMERYDVLLTPTLASPPLPLGVLGLSPAQMSDYFTAVSAFTPFTGIMNYTGQPSMSVPLATSRSGLPIGVMFSGRYGEEALLFRLAGQLEQAAPWAARRPDV
ncbi:amidase [Novosphingobium aquimarinum]|uniref:amidase n=1 Tax=Novosphingobium aquimarinum TaxID=2682494 RepID=UPI001E4B92B5|nr:amidase family protein [Novosphingobium aquimarinum]